MNVTGKLFAYWAITLVGHSWANWSAEEQRCLAQNKGFCLKNFCLS